MMTILSVIFFFLWLPIMFTSYDDVTTNDVKK